MWVCIRQLAAAGLPAHRGTQHRCALLVTSILLAKHDSSPAYSGDGDVIPNQLQLQMEAHFRSALNGTRIGEHLYELTLNAHIAGSPENYDTAFYVRDQMRSFGLDAELQPFDVLLCYEARERGATHTCTRFIIDPLSSPLLAVSASCVLPFLFLSYPTQTRKVEVFASIDGPSIYQSTLAESNFSVDPSTLDK